MQGVQYRTQLVEFLRDTIPHFDKVGKVARERIVGSFVEKVLH